MNAVSLWWLLVVVTKLIYVVDANWITGNLCWSMPCMNGGSCFGSAYTYLCVCPINYNGALCEKRLGICQENPCGNRGLCVEKNLTSFECRCYFDYMGPTCDEYVMKNDRHIWSSLLPAQTRILFNMLQEAYRTKTKGKSIIASGNGQIDFIGLLSKPTTSIPMTSTTVETPLTTHQDEKIKIEHIIQAHDIQLDKLFPEISTASTSDINTYDYTEQSPQFESPTTLESNTVFTTMSIENITTTAIEQSQSVTFNTMDDQEIGNITSTPVEWWNDNNNIDDITTQNLLEETNDSTESIVITSTIPIELTSSNIDITIDDDDSSYLSDQAITSPINASEQPSSTDVNTISQTVHNQLLYKLCQQIFSRISPNASSAATAAAAAALSIASNSSSINNNTVNVLMSWLSEHLNLSTNTIKTSTMPSLVVNDIQTSSIPLRRIDMDDVLYQMNNNIDNEH